MIGFHIDCYATFLPVNSSVAVTVTTEIHSQDDMDNVDKHCI